MRSLFYWGKFLCAKTLISSHKNEGEKVERDGDYSFSPSPKISPTKLTPAINQSTTW
jgi:hypothetical protein